MKHKRLKLSVVILLGLGLTGLHAQESINASGGDATGSGGSASYSVGQVVYTTNTGSTGSVAQGVQHAFEIYTLGVEDIEDILLTAYPNPTTDYLTLELNAVTYSDVTYQLFDIHGRLLRSHKITDNHTQIAMSDLPAAVYFVKVSQGNNEVKTFKIVKN